MSLIDRGRALGERADALKRGYETVRAEAFKGLESADPRVRAVSQFRLDQAKSGLIFLDQLASNLYLFGRDLEAIPKPFQAKAKAQTAPVLENVIGRMEVHHGFLADPVSLARHVAGNTSMGDLTWWAPWRWPGEAYDSVTQTAKETAATVVTLAGAAWLIKKIVENQKKKN